MQKLQFLRWWVSTAFDMAVPTKRPWMPRCSTVQPCWRCRDVRMMWRSDTGRMQYSCRPRRGFVAEARAWIEPVAGIGGGMGVGR
jgi:hypothetical protein